MASINKREIVKGDGQCSMWEANRIDLNLTKHCSKVYEEGFIVEYAHKIFERLTNKEAISQEINELGFTKVLRIATDLYHNQLIDYFSYFATCFTLEREKISIDKMSKRMFNLPQARYKWPEDLLELKQKLVTIIDDEYYKQCKLFVSENHIEMSMKNETWTLYWENGPGLNCRTFDFSKITSPTIRKEVMLYFKFKLRLEINFRNDRGIAAIVNAMNFLVKNRPDINYLADVNKHDVISLLNFLEYIDKSQFNTKLTPNSVRKTIQHCGSLMSYIIKYSKEGHPLSYPIPHKNLFGDISFHNISQMEHNTDIIPELVFEQFKKYENELSNVHQLMCHIFENTGMRAGEVVNLQKGCVTYSEDFKAWVLKYKVTKSLEARRMKAQSDYNIVVVPEEVAFEILLQESSTEELRVKYDVKNIFINNVKSGHKHARTQGNAFVDALNRMAKKNQILGEDGNLWHFTSRQYRKKVAVDLIENNGTPHELARQFGHSGTRTGMKYYAEIRKMRLAELNHKFFEKRFNVLIGDENLKLYSEEERRALYVDFCEDYREVELGVCTKHMSDGPCGKRSGKSSCANCVNLCTGTKYLSKWIRLRESQKNLLEGLIKIYENQGIRNYEEYREYQKELFLFKSYDDVVEKISRLKELNVIEKQCMD